MKIDVLPRDCTTDLSHPTCISASLLLVHFPLTSVEAGAQNHCHWDVSSVPGPWVTLVQVWTCIKQNHVKLYHPHWHFTSKHHELPEQLVWGFISNEHCTIFPFSEEQNSTVPYRRTSGVSSTLPATEWSSSHTHCSAHTSTKSNSAAWALLYTFSKASALQFKVLLNSSPRAGCENVSPI